MNRSLSTTVCALASILVCSLAAADRQEITFADASVPAGATAHR